MKNTEAEFQRLVDQMPVGVALRDTDSTLTFVNRACLDIAGLPPSTTAADLTPAMFHPDDRVAAVASMEHTLRTGEPYELELRIVRPDGEIRLVLVRSSVRRDDDGAISGYLATLVDLTERREQALGRSERLHRLTLNSIPGVIVGLYDADLRCLFMEGGGTGDELNSANCTGRTLAEFANQATADQVEPGMREALEGREQFYEYHSARDGSYRENHVGPLRSAEGNIEGVIIVSRDVTDRRLEQDARRAADELYQRQLQHMADHDPLTGLLNRRGLERELNAQLARVRRYDCGGVLLLLDLDGFKAVNDSRGHAAGDALIVGVADDLRERLRETDVIARMGGDEFAVILPSESTGEGEVVAQALVEAVREHAHGAVADGGSRVTASIGLAAFDGESTDDEMLVRADHAMYDAKAAGRDCYALRAGDDQAVPSPLYSPSNTRTKPRRPRA